MLIQNPMPPDGKVFLAIGEALCREEFEPLLLWALGRNWSAGKFYESMGGTVVEERPYFRWGASYPLLGYAWKDLGQFVGG